jgi:hypothetical protein
MAEEKKSIEISYKANLNDLISKLKQMPNITDQEAKKMVSALDRQLKQAEKAAKQSAEASKKAAQQAGKAAQRGADDFKQLADSAQHAERKMERVGEASGDIDRGFSSVGLALRGVNPQLAEAADGIADAFAVTEGLTMSMTALNPVVLAVAAAVGALALGYVAYNQEIENAKQLTLDMRDAQTKLNSTYDDLRANFDDSLTKLRDIQDEYALITGEIDEYELALRRTERSTEAMFQTNIDQQKEVIKQREEELDLINRIMKGNLQGIQNAAILSDSEKERLRNLQLLTAGVNKNVDLTANDYQLNLELKKIQVALTNEIGKQNQALEIFKGHQKDAVSMAMEIQEFENETAKAKEAQAKNQAKVNKGKAEEIQLQEELMELELEAMHRQIDLEVARIKTKRDMEKEFQAMFMSDQELAIQMINDKYDKEFQRIEDLGTLTGKEDMARQMAMVLRTEQARELHDLEMSQIDEKIKKEEEYLATVMEGHQALVSSVGEFANATIEAVQKTSENNAQTMGSYFGDQQAAMEEAAMKTAKKQAQIAGGLFVMQQAAAKADIAFNTAKAITAAMAYPPPLSGMMIAAAVGTGAAQMAIVTAQQPPQPSYHMGGLAPDETTARVLKGEAILDRATVNRIGGEEGVKQLQQGTKSDSPMVIIQPFKHFGRFTREIGFVPPKQTGIRAY